VFLLSHESSRNGETRDFNECDEETSFNTLQFDFTNLKTEFKKLNLEPE
jgi:hypothetical protein